MILVRKLTPEVRGQTIVKANNGVYGMAKSNAKRRRTKVIVNENSALHLFEQRAITERKKMIGMITVINKLNDHRLNFQFHHYNSKWIFDTLVLKTVFHD